MTQHSWINLGDNRPLSLAVRQWSGAGRPKEPPLILLHGLASNSRTWDMVAPALAAQGYRVLAYDQRGHGLSDKPDTGYNSTAVAGDLHALLDVYDIEKAVVIGQSWGANVALAFGAHYPERVHGLGFVDGGYIDLQMRPDSSWDAISQQLRPPPLAGIAAEDLRRRIRDMHPDWPQGGIEATMANFELLPDGTIRPWLTLERHMLILRSLWEERPGALFPQVLSPVYIAMAEDHRNPTWMASKRKQVAAAAEALTQVQVESFAATDHDIHVHRADELARSLLRELDSGIWSK